eukprot:TRINITY_DN17908_c0_g1_i3.p1 TRINITY_DN17908_c0_g1~~TRINITY_DN17908_c0_g1_i3.p1  ORF type:complete len:388 (-),score=61.13 TRINITY_DN17908_c0_g1_i3:73-1236(-)
MLSPPWIQVDRGLHVCAVLACEQAEISITQSALIQHAIKSTFGSRLQQARVRVEISDCERPEPAEMSIEEVDRLLGYSGKVPETEVSLVHCHTQTKFSAVLFFLPNGLVSIRLFGQTGNLCCTPKRQIEHRGWFGEGTAWQLLKAEEPGLHIFKSAHDPECCVGVGRDSLCICRGTIEEKLTWKLNVHLPPAPVVHLINELAMHMSEPGRGWECASCPGVISVENILTAAECELLVRTAEDCGYDDRREGARQSEWCQLQPPENCCTLLFQRLLPFLPELHGECAVGLNPRWRFYRYQDEDQFKPHYDQPSSSEHSTSHMSVLLYLTQAGATRFLAQQDSGWVGTTIQAPRGAAVLFWHGSHMDSPLHEGCVAVSYTHLTLPTKRIV